MVEKTKYHEIAVVRCDLVSETCPGVGCFKAFNERKSCFEAHGTEMQIIAFFTCRAARAGESTVW